MAPPTSYSEATYETFLVAALGDIATALGWTTSTAQVQEAVYDVELLLGDEIANLDDIAALRALGRRAILRAAVNSLSTRYDLASATERLSRSQVVKAAADMLALAEAEAIPFDTSDSSGNVVRVDTLRRPDPYRYWPDEVLEAFVP